MLVLPGAANFRDIDQRCDHRRVARIAVLGVRNGVRSIANDEATLRRWA